MALRGDGRGLLSKTIAGLLGFAEPWNYKEFFWGGQISPATTTGQGDGWLAALRGVQDTKTPGKYSFLQPGDGINLFLFFLQGCSYVH